MQSYDMLHIYQASLPPE